jgi:hypothetical protein
MMKSKKMLEPSQRDIEKSVDQCYVEALTKEELEEYEAWVKENMASEELKQCLCAYDEVEYYMDLE